MDQRPSNDEPTLPATIFAVAILVSVGLLFMSFADDKATGETWVYRYQTLITGILAVGAAFATIRQMRTSDAIQERRDRRNRYENLRNEIIAVKRLKAYLPKAIRSALINLDAYVDHRDDSNPFQKATGWILATMSVDEMQVALKDFRVTSCAQLLDALVFEALETCKREAEAIDRIVQPLAERIGLTEEDIQRDELHRAIAFDRMKALGETAEQLANLVDGWSTAYLVNVERLHDPDLTP